MLKRVREKFLDSATFFCTVVAVAAMLFAVSAIIDLLFNAMVNFFFGR